ncbi:MAG TPA: DUF6355 family natural product biosynthesis protein [Pseudonocardiaceae bacterium]|jgi:hypothetical protein|nr:DUF6355 family natural product biosynthesis protein [Pseudonocardiaceae bacterium]
MYRTVIIPGILAAAFTLACTGQSAAATSTVTATQYPCGYDGFHGGEQPLYNHCGRTDVVIRVHHFFWQTTYDCVTPGVHSLDQGDSQWRIISAEYDGDGCNIPGPAVGP